MSGPDSVASRTKVIGPVVIGLMLFFVGGGVFGFLFGRGRDLPESPPIAFNHEVHVVENEFECTFCHTHILEETYAGLPDLEICSMCHSEALGDSQNEKVLVRLIENETPLEWNHRFRQPAHVFYSHQRHVAVGGLECKTCHGDIGQSSVMPARVERLTMDFCIDCHEGNNVSTDCTACHR